VSATQTIVEFGSFTLLHVLSVPSAIANGVAIVLSASYNFLMNRNVTFKSSSNFGRSMALFMLLWVWNYLFGSIMLAWLPSAFGWNAVLVPDYGMSVRVGLSAVQGSDFSLNLQACQSGWHPMTAPYV